MTYELALKLKEAGFPQNRSGISYCPNCSNVADYNADAPNCCDNPDYDNGLTIPDLTELIEACNPTKSDDMGLKTDLDRWHAWYDYNGYFEHNEKFRASDGTFNVALNVYGQTPEEAVASLYLALKK